MRALLIIALLLTTHTACSHPHQSADEVDTISVTGFGEVEVSSDQATLRLEISVENKVLSQAKTQADKHYSSFLSVLDTLNLSTDELTLQQLNMNPVYEWVNTNGQSKRFQTGYLVSRTLSFELNELDKLPALLEALANLKGTSIQSIQRGLQNPSAVIAQATAKAAEDAKQRAAFIADQFDRALGDVKSVNVHNKTPFRPAPRMKSGLQEFAMAADAPSEHLGQQSVSVTLSVVFNLK